MNSFLEPATTQSQIFSAVSVLLLLAFSATLIFVAPLAMPEDYSWASNAISESAAQSVHGAWIARLGFLCFGFGVLWLANSLRSLWARGAYWSHMAFGLFMVSTAAFSHRPWLADVPFDSFEDFLHSFTASGMGFAFSLGVLVRLLQRRRSDSVKRAFDAVALVIAIVMPLLSGLWPSLGGLIQRLMFVIGYLWYGEEALAALELNGNAPH